MMMMMMMMTSLLAAGADPVDLEFAQDCLVLVVANKGKPSPGHAGSGDPEGIITKILTPFDFNEDSTVTSTSIGFGLVNDQATLRNSDGPISGITASKNVEPVNVIVAPTARLSTLPCRYVLKFEPFLRLKKQI
nr:hypothetical protein BaRGS_035150 [Batillaria attramentaria]